MLRINSKLSSGLNPAIWLRKLSELDGKSAAPDAANSEVAFGDF
jgi:hypothetical protein